jgi:hypothetical protein
MSSSDAADRRAAELVRVAWYNELQQWHLWVFERALIPFGERRIALDRLDLMREFLAAELRAAEARGRAAERERCERVCRDAAEAYDREGMKAGRAREYEITLAAASAARGCKRCLEEIRRGA